MLTLDHLTVIAPTLEEGVAHVRNCLDLTVPSGARHAYMGTHNCRMLLGYPVYLEIVALDPEGQPPGRPRWFGLDDQARIRADWTEGRRLRGWVANTTRLDDVLARHAAIFGGPVALPETAPEFAFTIPGDGALPMDGAMPSVIDHRGDSTHVAALPDLGARLLSFQLEHPEPDMVARLYRDLAIDRPPNVVEGPQPRYRALVSTPKGLRTLS